MGEPTASVTRALRGKQRDSTRPPKHHERAFDPVELRRDDLSDCVDDGRLDSRDRQHSSAAGSPVVSLMR